MNIPNVETLPIEGLLRITPARFADDRGFFSETFNKAAFREIGVACEFIQDNHVLSHVQGTLRGLHFQIAPYAQAKLVRVVHGAIFDVAVDIRRGSGTYGKSCALTLSAASGDAFYVPAGFAHGYCTLEADTEVIYKVDAPYSRTHERGLLWRDPQLGIAWPVDERAAHVIERDQQLPRLCDLETYF